MMLLKFTSTAETLGITYHHRDNFFEVDVP